MKPEEIDIEARTPVFCKAIGDIESSQRRFRLGVCAGQAEQMHAILETSIL
jgi:hypothetical protein